MVEKAREVLIFRLLINKACKEQGIAAPTDEQVSKYLNDGGAMDVKKFMDDYYIQMCEQKSSNIDKFIRNYTLDSYNPMERAALLRTLNKVYDKMLIQLWNIFVESAMKVGEDSHIYHSSRIEELYDTLFTNGDFDNLKDLRSFISSCKSCEIDKYFFQYIDRKVIVEKTHKIKDHIIAWWGDIFEDIMRYPSAYANLFDEQGKEYHYFFKVIYPIIADKLGYISYFG